MARIKFLLVVAIVTLFSCSSGIIDEPLKTGAEQTEKYLPLLKGQRVGVVANHTSLVGTVHLVDTLIALGINVDRIFSPEHGFRGTADAGAHIEGGIDESTGIRVISLYGSHRRPTMDDLDGLDIILFDIQDVGTRFYTYISTMQYVMEVAAEADIPFLILDRPNPNGHYVDGPLLDTLFRSFVGMQPVPVVHGMTVGEYGMMINSEGWLFNAERCELTVIPCLGYNRDTDRYILPVPPSPNLPNANSINLYPSTCFFEGTVFSVGRGTDAPFQLFGHPDYLVRDFSFTPEPGPGAANPKLNGVECFGVDLRGASSEGIVPDTIIHIEWIIDAYNNFQDTATFFNSYFNTLAGTDVLMKQIRRGMTAEEIRKSWQPGIRKFKGIREKYLLY